MIKQSSYADRRKALMKQIGPNSVLVLPSAPEILRNGDAFYAFRQQSDFYYLTGFDEPEAVLVLLPNRPQGEYVLFNRVRDRSREIWDGPRAGQEGARKDFMANEAFPIDELAEKLPDLLSGRDNIHYTLGINHEFDEVLLKAVNEVKAKIRGGVHAPISFVDITHSIHEMRLIKEPAEIEVMQKAIDITHDGHLAAMRACKPGRYEYELEAAFLYECHRQGARSTAYTSIVGAGKNTCVLHYVANNELVKDGDLVLIDAGAEYHNYAADITRTFPANGKFTSEQRAIYELVLEAQLKGIEAVKPGADYLKPQEAIVKVITQGLIDLKILQGNLDRLIEDKAYFPFYMHKSGHWLGIDVHDAGRYKVGDNWRTFAPGMMLTVEPGIYISADIPGVDKRWHNIGVRIEDDILVTSKGREVLSQKIPKQVQEIEALMRAG